MERLNVVSALTTLLLMLKYNEATISTWTSWAKTASICEKEGLMTRTRLHMDHQHRSKYYERYTMSMDDETLPNIALHQLASMSSKYEDYGADLLTDGILMTDMFFGSCAQTKMESSPWFRIDLGSGGYQSYVEEVVIFNRFDCCSSRANNLSITIGDDPTGDGNTLCNVQENMALQIVRILCKKPIFGRYIHLRVPGPQILHLCEVQALGGGRYKNVALGKTITVSSHFSGDLGYLTDGDFSHNFETNFGSDKGPWTRIDIGAVAQVHMVRLYMGRGTTWIENSIVSVGKYSGTNNLEFCGVATKAKKISGAVKESYIVKCNLQGRYVQINMVKNGDGGLSMSEVEVLGVL